VTIKGKRKVREGIVVSDKMDKTISVDVGRLVQHPLYRRMTRRTSTFKAHDETNQCKVGDRVRIIECRPLSATKRWRLLEVVEKAKVAQEGAGA
jgi:small subunit ribosomal protein S17